MWGVIILYQACDFIVLIDLLCKYKVTSCKSNFPFLQAPLRELHVILGWPEEPIPLATGLAHNVGM